MGLLLGLVFAAGVGCVWFGVFMGVTPSTPVAPARLHGLLEDTGLDITPSLFLGLIAGCAAAGGLVASWIVGVPAVTIIAVLAGGLAPVGWARSRHRRRLVERERAWPAVLSQLADALAAGLAWPAAVSLVARSGPAVLRGEWAVFAARLRGSDLDAALAGLQASAGERTADSIVLLLRAALVELPAGGLAPVLREMSVVLGERLEAREKARSRASKINTEAAILAISPLVILLLVGAATPGYLNAYRSTGGTIVALLAGGLIAACYLLMRHLGRVPEPHRTSTGRQRS